MSRRSSRRVEVRANYTESAIDSEDVIQTTSSSVISKTLKTKEPTETEMQDPVDTKKRVRAVKKEDIEKSNMDSKKSPAKTKPKKNLGPEEFPLESKSPATKGKRKAKAEEEADEDVEDKKIKKKRKTKAEKDNEPPLAPRTDVSTLTRKLFIGAHVSASGGVQNSIKNALHVGGNSFALFLKNQRQWSSAPLDPEVCEQFQAFCKEHNYDPAKHCLPHGSYLINLAQPDPEKAEQALNCFVDDLQRCEALGIRLYNFHPGSSLSFPRPEAITRIAKALNKAHKSTSTVCTVLENMAGAGNVIGSKWEDLRDIIAQVDDKSRVGVCIDTCHTFAAGHDLRTPEAFSKTMDDFSKIVGLEYLKALHLNDSKAPMSSNRDLHANIGTGFLGLRAFHNVVNYEPFQHLPMVLETPVDKKGPDGKTIEDKSIWATEIKLLENLVGVDVESEEFKEMEQRLQDQGAEERKKIQSQVDKKRGASKGQKNITEMFQPTKGKKKATAAADENEDDEEGCSH